MLHGEINPGDVLEWKTFGGQSTKILIVKADEIMVYGNAKGKDKKYRSAFWIRALHAFDDEPELIEETALRANSKRVAGDANAPDNDSPINDFGEAEAAEAATTYGDEFSQAESPAKQSYLQDAPEAVEKPKKPLNETPLYKRSQ